MTNVTLKAAREKAEPFGERAELLAARLEDGARMLINFAATLTDAEWSARVPHDGRKIGVIVHHVASAYPVEIELARMIAAGTPMTGITSADVDAMNAKHAAENDAVTKEQALDLL